LPEDPMVLYLFNPLPELGMRSLLANLERSLKARPRDVYFVYHNPEHRAWLENSSLWEFTGTHQFVIYRSVERGA
jgi:hypothetical protein